MDTEVAQQVHLGTSNKENTGYQSWNIEMLQQYIQHVKEKFSKITYDAQARNIIVSGFLFCFNLESIVYISDR